MKPVRVLCRCRCHHFASSINLKIGYVLQIGWNHPKKHFKYIAKIFQLWVWGPQKWVLCENWVFWSKMQILKWRMGGIRPPENFIFEIRLVRYLGHPFAKL